MSVSYVTLHISQAAHCYVQDTLVTCLPCLWGFPLTHLLYQDRFPSRSSLYLSLSSFSQVHLANTGSPVIQLTFGTAVCMIYPCYRKEVVAHLLSLESQLTCWGSRWLLPTSSLKSPKDEAVCPGILTGSWSSTSFALINKFWNCPLGNQQLDNPWHISVAI